MIQLTGFSQISKEEPGGFRISLLYQQAGFCNALGKFLLPGSGSLRGSHALHGSRALSGGLFCGSTLCSSLFRGSTLRGSLFRGGAFSRQLLFVKFLRGYKAAFCLGERRQLNYDGVSAGGGDRGGMGNP